MLYLFLINNNNINLQENSMPIQCHLFSGDQGQIENHREEISKIKLFQKSACHIIISILTIGILAIVVACILCAIEHSLANLRNDSNFFKRTITVNHNSTQHIAGSGQIQTRKINLDGVALGAIEAQNIGDVHISASEKGQYLEMSADDNLLDYLTPQVNGQKITLGLKKGVSISTKNPIKYKLFLPQKQINELTVSGSSSIQVTSLVTEKFKCKISGQGDVTINNGRVNSQTVEISGQGTYNASNLNANHSKITISGQGNAYVHASQLLIVEISGQGSCVYSGKPSNIVQQISGQGKIKAS